MPAPADRRTFFHCCPADADPQRLLDPERQFTEPWGASEEGARCDKCGGEGTAAYECRSCLEAGAEPACPACQGRIRFSETCPACLGGGTIANSRRRGIAVFPARAGLYRYMAERDADVAGSVVVELEGELAEERDFDADSGALLLAPRRIVEAHPFDPELVEAIRARPD
jgi:hypothetical protein